MNAIVWTGANWPDVFDHITSLQGYESHYLDPDGVLWFHAGGKAYTVRRWEALPDIPARSDRPQSQPKDEPMDAMRIVDDWLHRPGISAIVSCDVAFAIGALLIAARGGDRQALAAESLLARANLRIAELERKLAAATEPVGCHVCSVPLAKKDGS